MKIFVDKDKAYDVFGKLVNAYRLKEYPYDQTKVQVPHVFENLPKKMRRGGIEEGMYFHVGCYWMRGQIESDTALKALSKIYDQYPDLFIPEVASTTNPEDIIPVLANNGLGRNKRDSARFWVENSRRICELWDGNPLNIFEGAELLDNPFDEVLVPRIRNDGKGNGFLGFQEKMVAMKTYFYMDTGLIKPFVTPLPVDFHVLRMCLMHEIITVSGGNGKNWYVPKLLTKARELSFNYSLNHGVSPLELCDAIWLYGRSMCKHDPRAGSSVAKERNGRKTPIFEVEPTWTDAQMKTYRNSCGSCVVAETCRYKVRSALYYISGKLIPEEKDECPTPSLEGLSLRDIKVIASPKKLSNGNGNGNDKKDNLLFSDDHFQLFDSGLYVPTTTEPTTG